MRVWTKKWSMNNHENPNCEFSLELGQKLELSLKTPNPEKTSNNGDGRRETMIFVALIRSLRYSRARSTKTKTDVSYISSS